MTLRTLMILCATGISATALAVWASTGPAAARGPATTAPVPIVAKPGGAGPGAPALIALPDLVDHASFQAGATLRLEGRLGHRVLPAESDSQTFLFVDVAADTDARARVVTPLDLAIVIDRSGSMKGRRLLNAMAAARSAIERLRDGDVVSVITYNTAADVVVAPTVIDAAMRARVLRQLARPTAGGNTCISCGLDAAARSLAGRAGMLSRILLLSDGAATAGIRDLPGFRRIAEECRDQGTSITTIGVDVDYDERIMATLARDSNGRHFFVENPDALATILDGEMATLGRTIADGGELVIDLAPGVVAERVFDRAITTRGSQLVVPLGSFAAGEHKTVLAELRVPHGAAGERPIARVRLRYDDLALGGAGAAEGLLTAQLSADPSRLAPLDGVVSARLAGSETAAALEQANQLFRDGDAVGAQEVLRHRAAAMEQRRTDAKDATTPDDADEVSAAYARSEQALTFASAGFDAAAATPPPTSDPPAGAAAPAKAAERAGKAQIRSNAENGYHLSE